MSQNPLTPSVKDEPDFKARATSFLSDFQQRDGYGIRVSHIGELAAMLRTAFKEGQRMGQPTDDAPLRRLVAAIRRQVELTRANAWERSADDEFTTAADAWERTSDVLCSNPGPLPGTNACQRPRGHDGDHQSSEAEILSSWPQAPTANPIPADVKAEFLRQGGSHAYGETSFQRQLGARAGAWNAAIAEAVRVCVRMADGEDENARAWAAESCARAVRALETAQPMADASSACEPFPDETTQAFINGRSLGRDEEKERITRWLRMAGAGIRETMGKTMYGDALFDAAKQIEAGDHLSPQGRDET